MVINYFGEGCFRLQSGELSLVINPTSNRFKADVVLKTIALTEGQAAPEEISYPGEYEIKGIEIQGWPLKEESTEDYVKTAFAVTWEDMRFVFLGHMSQPTDGDFVEKLGEADVVFVPTGDRQFISPEDAAKLVKKIDPKVVVPAYYKTPNDLVKALGLPSGKEDKWTFKRKELAEIKGRTIVIERKD